MIVPLNRGTYTLRVLARRPLGIDTKNRVGDQKMVAVAMKMPMPMMYERAKLPFIPKDS